jgi:hypothetical protein
MYVHVVMKLLKYNKLGLYVTYFTQKRVVKRIGVNYIKKRV